MLNDLRIEKLTRQGIALMQEERSLALRGDFAALEELNRRKEEFLAQMELLAASIDKKGPKTTREARRQEIATLFDIIRRRAEENRYLLRAAEAGVKSARRRIRALTTGEGDLGAYDASGAPVGETNNSSTNSQRV